MAQAHRRDWNLYWRRAGNVPVFGQFTKNGDSLRIFWAEYLAQALADPERNRVLDMACGSGAVSTVAADVAERADSGIQLFCLDYSGDAVTDLRRRMPQVGAVASDAGAAPFAGGAFDVVASQFGLEYAGPAAFVEAARLISANGVLCAICHLGSGPIHRECLDNLDTVETVLGCRFLPLAKSAFDALFALDRGDGSAQAAQEAHRALTEAAATMRRLIETKGAQAASGTPARLFQDVGYMYNQRRKFVPRQVFEWIDLMSGEVTAYAGRMRAMSQAALDETAIGDIRRSLISAGLSVEEPQKLPLGPDAEPGAWVLKAAR